MSHLGYDSLSLESLSAFVDGELEPMVAATVAAAAYADRDAAVTLSEIRDQNAGLKRLFGHIAEEPIPASMQMLVNSFARGWRQAS